MRHLVVIGLLVLRGHWLCTAYTHGIRNINTSFTTDEGVAVSVQFDPVLATPAEAVDAVCSLYPCEADRAALEADVISALASQLHQHYQPPDYSALIPLSSRRAADRLRVLQTSVQDIITNFRDSLLQWCTARHPGQRCPIDGALTEKIDVSVALFYDKKYDESLAMSYAMLSFLLENKPLVDAGALSSQQLEWVYISFAEASRIVGNLNASTWGYTMRTFIERQPGQRLLYRLRTLTAVSPVPPDYETSRRWRSEMVTDLRLFTNEVLKGSATVTIEELMEFSTTPFNLCHQGLNDRDAQIEIMKAHHALCPDLTYTSPALAHQHAQIPARTSVGFVSHYFSDHSIGKIFVETILFLSIHHPELDVYVFYIDTTLDIPVVDRPEYDHITRALIQTLGPTRMIHVPPRISDIRNVISNIQPVLDILVFTDVGMDLLTYLLACSRFAQYQMVWWGHPITVGMLDNDNLSIDYFLSLDVELEEAADEHYTEQMVRMNYINTAPFVKTPLGPNFEAERESLLADLAMPATAKYCLVIGRLFKLHPVFDDAVHSILSTNPDTFLVLIFEKVVAWNLIVVERLSRRLGPTLLSRVRLGGFGVYSKLLSHADVVLDTFPYGGCLTTHDALANGIPLVTLPSDFARGRYSIAMYKQMGHMDLVANNASHYVQLVSKLLVDDTFNLLQKDAIEHRFHNYIHKNKQVAEEWSRFFVKLARG